MPLHDEFAAKAIERGRNSREFRMAAQRHANGTWLYAIGAAIVWYLFGWPWALIPIALAVYAALRSVSSTLIAVRIEKQERHAETDIEAIVQAYGKFLERSAPAPGRVADVDKLPFPKEQIKAAMIGAIMLTDDEEMRNALRTSYLELANWQENVGERDQGIDFQNLDLAEDTLVLAKRVSELAKEAEKWQHLVQQESETLQRELAQIEAAREESGAP